MIKCLMVILSLGLLPLCASAAPIAGNCFSKNDYPGLGYRAGDQNGHANFDISAGEIGFVTGVNLPIGEPSRHWTLKSSGPDYGYQDVSPRPKVFANFDLHGLLNLKYWGTTGSNSFAYVEVICIPGNDQPKFP